MEGKPFMLEEHANTISFNVKKLNHIFGRVFRNYECIATLEDQIGSSVLLLGFIYGHPDGTISQKDLLERFSITKSTLSKSLALLEQKEYISRKLDNNDHRVRYISVTEKGAQVVKAADEVIKKLNEVMLEGFTKEEVEQFLSFLLRAMNNLKEEKGAIVYEEKNKRSVSNEE